MTSYQMLDVRVVDIEPVTAQVKRFTLADPQAGRCPPSAAAATSSCKCRTASSVTATPIRC